MKTTSPTLGGDPEFFIWKYVKGKYEIISADKYLPSKANKANGYLGYIEKCIKETKKQLNEKEKDKT